LKKILLVTVILVLLSIVVIAAFFLDLRRYAEQSAGLKPTNVVVDIPAGQPFKTTTQTLFKLNLINSPLKFNLVARLKGYDKRLKAGEYSLCACMSPLQIMEKLVKGEVKLYKVTIPEGLNIYQIAALVAEAGFSQRSTFIEAATDANLAHKYGIDADTFEGYLFPETYYFPKNPSAESIIASMVKHFWLVFGPAWQERSKQLGFSTHQIVTLASIIEKETSAPFERPLISSVFHNRLKMKMRLESDPTVIYGLKDFNGNLKREHLETATPYNTYMRAGLPAGPIASPGKESLEAALYPADTKFIYFVSKKNKTHQFSTNLIDHNRAVRQYQLQR
jgi:peptidoglycan lytic transglycosylase G